MGIERLTFWYDETDEDAIKTLRKLVEAQVRFTTVPFRGKPSIYRGAYHLHYIDPTTDYWEQLDKLLYG